MTPLKKVALVSTTSLRCWWTMREARGRERLKRDSTPRGRWRSASLAPLRRGEEREEERSDARRRADVFFFFFCKPQWLHFSPFFRRDSLSRARVALSSHATMSSTTSMLQARALSSAAASTTAPRRAVAATRRSSPTSTSAAARSSSSSSSAASRFATAALPSSSGRSSLSPLPASPLCPSQSAGRRRGSSHVVAVR